MAKPVSGKGKGGSKSPAKREGFSVMLNDTLDSIKEPEGLPEGPYVFNVRGSKVTKDGDTIQKVLFILEAHEAKAGQANGDLAAYEPVFQTFDFSRATDVQMCKRFILAGGVDPKLTMEKAVSALTGTRPEGVITRTESTKQPGRMFTNVRNLGYPSA